MYQDYQLRVISERFELDVKIEKLDNLVKSESFKTLVSIEADLMKSQLEFMKEYSHVLTQRISYFKET
jgi:hypothetical protein